jgi:energy-coupling factor transport system permease protein
MITYSVFQNYERPSPLHKINPSVKMLISLAVMLFLSIVFDHPTLVRIITIGLILLLPVGRVPVQVIARAMLPFILLGIGFLWMNALLPRTSGTVIFTVGPLSISREGAQNGVSFFLRALGFGVWSLLFVATTHPTSFILSLIHQLRVAPRIAFSALAAYRYLPSLQLELEQIRVAHQLRGLGEVGGIRGKIQQAYRYTVPLLAGALRRATRVAAAMEARAFSGRERTWYRREQLHWHDLYYAIAIGGAVGLVIWWSSRTGSLQLWNGRLWE